jgi:hypothetical protein
MRALKADRALLVAALGAMTWGCQVVGGLNDLSLGAGGSGGSGSGAGGVGGGLPSRDPLVWEAGEPPATMVYELPGWMDFSNNSVTRTSQIGPNTLRLGYLDDEPRPRNVGKGWGLLLEPARTNLLPNSRWRGPGWASTGDAPGGAMNVSSTAGNDPAGGAEAVVFSSKGGQQSAMALGSGTVASSWLSGVDGSEPYAYFAYGPSAVPVLDPAWRRYEVPGDAASPDVRFRLETQSVGGYAAIQGETRIGAYAAQVENGRYPSSYIPTNGAQVTREADRLHVNRDDFAPGGYFDVTIRYAPHYSMAEQQYDHDLLAVEADGVFVRMQPGGRLVLFVAGAQGDVRIEGLDWEREQTLVVQAQYLPDTRSLVVAGATTGNDVAAQLGPMKPIAIDPRVWLLGDEDGPQESSDLKNLVIR